MQLVAPEKGWARTSNGHLFYTSDNGGHWTDISPKAPGHTSDTFFLNESHGWVLLSNENEQSNLISFEVASTSDSGRTWAISHMMVPSQKPAELDGWGWIDFADPHHGWVVLHANSSSAFSWGLLLATDDGGMTWRELPQAPVAGRPVFFNPRDGWISGPAWAGRYSTHDGGRTWGGAGGPSDLPESVPAHATYGDLKFTSPDHGFLPIWLSPSNDERKSKGTALILYTTDDAGRTWRRDRTLTDSDVGSLDHVKDMITVAGADESVMIAAMNDKLPKRRLTLVTVGRKGKVVREDSMIPLREHDYLGQFSFADRTNGWAFTGLGSLWSTTDGGATWRDISPGRITIPR